jgi:hypothetical protein
VKRERTETVQTAVRLPREMHERLKQSPDGVSEEIRRRLERSFELDAFDPRTRDLVEAVAWMADQIERDTMSSWHQRPKAHETLVEALQTYLAKLKPAPSGGTPGVSDMWDSFIDDPPTLGRAIARHYVRFKEELQKSEAELNELHRKEKKS